MQFKAGKYYVGDPCLVIHGRDWAELLRDTNHFDPYEDEFTFRGQPIYAAHTKHGDGSCYDQEERLYPVDSGLIGIIPFEIIDESNADCGQVIEFREDFEVNACDGLFRFGDIVIDTRMGWV